MTERRARPRSVTMHDVAGAAGVSTMTVSNVINGRTARVSDATRERVMAVIAELGYRVNTPARSLRQGRTGTIALAVPELSSEYYGQLADRLAAELQRHGLRLVVERTGGELDAELASLASSHLDAYDGIVLAVTTGSGSDLDPLRQDRPVVLIGERELSARYDHVMMANVDGARLATGLLLDRGATRVVALGARAAGPTSMSALRLAGYQEAHRERGLPVRAELQVSSSLSGPGVGPPSPGSSPRASSSMVCSPSPMSRPSARCARWPTAVAAFPTTSRSSVSTTSGWAS